MYNTGRGGRVHKEGRMEPLPMILQKAGLTSQRCLACDVCCRFASPTASFIPFFSSAEMEASGQTAETASHFLSPGRSSGERVLVVPHGEGYRCPFLQSATQECAIHERRPLDCRLYPFVLMYDEPGAAVWLGVDEVCPFAFEMAGRPELQQAAAEVAELLEGPLADTVANAPGLVSPFQEHVRQLRVLPEITRRVCRSDLGLARLVATSHKGLEGFFQARSTCLMGHAFPAMYLWTDLFNLHWKIEAGCLLVLAEDGGVSFLMAPPLGDGDIAQALDAARELMAAINGPRSGARAQEVDEELLPLFAAAGWQVGHQAKEYIASTEALVSLRGRHFDGRRHDLRRFEKSCRAAWRPYASADFRQCVALLRRWQQERAGHRPHDDFYHAQLFDSGFLHLRTLREAEDLGLRGFVAELECPLPVSYGPLPLGEGRVRAPEAGAAPPYASLTPPSPEGRGGSVEGRGRSIVAYTFGFPLADGQTFADFIEVADLSYPGLAAWVFQRFCREARDYPYLNLGTDSELPTLAQAKLACRPTRIVPSYVLNAPQ